MNEIELIQGIGTEVCEKCGEDSVCDIDPSACDRMANALILLDKFLRERSE